MATQGGGAATLNGSQGFELLKIKACSIAIHETIAMHA
jgi:hypothetical protein